MASILDYPRAPIFVLCLLYNRGMLLAPVLDPCLDLVLNIYLPLILSPRPATVPNLLRDPIFLLFFIEWVSSPALVSDLLIDSVAGPGISPVSTPCLGAIYVPLPGLVSYLSLETY